MENECYVARLTERAASDLDTGPAGEVVQGWGACKRGSSLWNFFFCLALITEPSCWVKRVNVTHPPKKLRAGRARGVNVTRPLEMYHPDGRGGGVKHQGGGLLLYTVQS